MADVCTFYPTVVDMIVSLLKVQLKYKRLKTCCFRENGDFLHCIQFPGRIFWRAIYVQRLTEIQKHVSVAHETINGKLKTFFEKHYSDFVI